MITAIIVAFINYLNIEGARLVAIKSYYNRIAFRYCSAAAEITEEAKPKGSLNNNAGIINCEGNVLGVIHHPESACELLLSGEDGRLLFESILEL